MTQLLGFLVALVTGSSALAFPIANGFFKGTGQFRATDGTFIRNYEVSIDHRNGDFQVVYRTDQGSEALRIAMVRMADGGYRIDYQNLINVGWGYCVDEIQTCHFEFRAPQGRFEQTIQQNGDALYTVGSRLSNGPKIIWRESLTKQSTLP